MKVRLGAMPLLLATIWTGSPSRVDGATAVVAFVSQLGAAVGAVEELRVGPALAGGAHFGLFDVLEQIFFFQSALIRFG